MGYFKEGRTPQHSTAALCPVCGVSGCACGHAAREPQLERGGDGARGRRARGVAIFFPKKNRGKIVANGTSYGTGLTLYACSEKFHRLSRAQKKRLLVRHIVVALMALPSSSESCPQLRPFFAFPFELFLDVLWARAKFCSFTFTVRESLPSRLTTTRPAVSSK